MRALAFALSLVVPVFVSFLAQAQTARGSTVRYFGLSADMLEEVDGVSGFLRETRQGTRVLSAVLEMCFPVAPSKRKDRLVATLTVEGSNLVGIGQTQVERLPVVVRLARKVTGKTFAFSGSIRRGSSETKVNLKDQSDLSEAEFEEQQPKETAILDAPPDFTKVSPGVVAATVKRDSFAALVKGLRTEYVKVDLDSLVTECDDLRSGHQTVEMKVEPERAAALIAKLKTAPGVSLAGWKEGNYIIESAVRLPTRNEWINAGRLDKEKLATAIADSFAKTWSATARSTSYNARTGELALKFKRPNVLLSEFDLTDNLEITMLVGPEKPGAPGAFILWTGGANITTSDEGSEPRLVTTPAAEGEGGSALQSIETPSLVAALARDLRGALWDSEKKAWTH